MLTKASQQNEYYTQIIQKQRMPTKKDNFIEST